MALKKPTLTTISQLLSYDTPKGVEIAFIKIKYKIHYARASPSISLLYPWIAQKHTPYDACFSIKIKCHVAKFFLIYAVKK